MNIDITHSTSRPGRAAPGILRAGGVAVALLLAAPALAGGFELTAQTVDCGGGIAAAGTFVLQGSIGQPEAGAVLAAGTFALTGGHWGGGAAPAPPACPTDLNDSGATDFSDLVTVLSSWGTCVGCPADLDGNGAVEFSDLISILSAWGPCDGW